MKLRNVRIEYQGLFQGKELHIPVYHDNHNDWYFEIKLNGKYITNGLIRFNVAGDFPVENEINSAVLHFFTDNWNNLKKFFEEEV